MLRQLSAFITLWAGLPLVSGAEEPIHFNRDIRPLLSDKCFYCHGFDENNRKADLRLDTSDGATRDLGGYAAIVPHDAGASELVARLFTDDADEMMPPPESEKSLSAEEKTLLKRWIDEGANYQQHWSLQPLVRPNSESSVDAFIAAGWERYAIEPVEMATPREQLRRLSYDLRGLPPTEPEVAAFAKDPSKARFAEFRDQWLDSLAAAEHQAVAWLDLVRWADTSGFVSDEPIAAGAYRAWIIEAIRQNLPFDQFSILQLAGDLIPNPSDESLIASGYNRIVNTNCESGAIEVEQLYKLKGEHVRAFGTVWMGMTTGCAECHDHKFDPISAKDYYSLAAYFDDLIEAGVYTPGDRRIPLHFVHDTPEQSKRDQSLAEELDSLKREIYRSSEESAQADWTEQRLADLKNQETRGDFVWAPAQLPAPRVVEGPYEIATRENRPVRRVKADGFTRHHAAEFMTGDVTIGGVKTDPKQDGYFFEVYLDPSDRPDLIGVQISHGDYGRLGWRTGNYETYYWGDDTSGELGKAHPWSDPNRVKRLGDLPKESGWMRLRVNYEDLIAAESGQNFESVGLAWLQDGGTIDWGDSGLELRSDKIAELQLAETAFRKWAEKPMNRQVYQRRNSIVAETIRTAKADRDHVQHELAREAFLEATQPEKMAQVRAIESELYTLRARAMPVLVSRGSEERKVTRVLNRGDFLDASGPIVEPATPAVFGETPGPSRLDLANWLFAEENPLTARVFVNRLWKQFYGRGLSETLEDVGTQGDWPSHPELLDWLAVEFRESGWDRQHLVRLLTDAQAYRLSSTPSPTLAEHDPSNRHHARQSRQRLPAEAIRDTALLAAGLLKATDEIPLESFFPYQPDAYWTRSDKVMFGSRHMDWETQPGGSQYQRSLYTFWKRQNIHPTMLAFDAPTRQECTAERNITNTPGQALALLNDPIFVEAARGLAQEIHREERDDDAKITLAFQRTLQRAPTPAERDILTSLLTTQRAHYTEHPSDAEALLEVGQLPASTAQSPSEFAAWIAVTRAILNLHETLTRS